MSNLATNSNVVGSNVGVTMSEDATKKTAKTTRKPRSTKGTPQTSTKTTEKKEASKPKTTKTASKTSTNKEVSAKTSKPKATKTAAKPASKTGAKTKTTSKEEAGAKKLSVKTQAQLREDAKKATEKKAKATKKDALKGLQDAKKEQSTLSGCMLVINNFWDAGYNRAFEPLGFKLEDMKVPAMMKLLKTYLMDKKNNFLYPVRKPMWKTENGKTTPVLNMQNKQRHETILVPFAEKYTPKKLWDALQHIQIKRNIIKL